MTGVMLLIFDYLEVTSNGVVVCGKRDDDDFEAVYEGAEHPD